MQMHDLAAHTAHRVGEEEDQQRRHVRADHARTLGNRRDGHPASSQRELRVRDLRVGIARHDRAREAPQPICIQ